MNEKHHNTRDNKGKIMQTTKYIYIYFQLYIYHH